MNNKVKSEYIKKAKSSPIWILEGRISKQNRNLLLLAGQGINCKNKRWRNIIEKRNTYRKVMLNKLKDFFKGKLDKESNPTYSDYVKSMNYNKEGQEVLKI